jgi:hypothetical protein
MFAEPFEAKDDYRIWLDLSETDELLAAADSREKRIMFTLRVQSGIYVQMIINIRPKKF